MSERASAASAVPPTAPARDVTGIAIDWLFDSPTVRLTRWSCLVRNGGVTSERQQNVPAQGVRRDSRDMSQTGGCIARLWACRARHSAANHSRG